MVVMFDGKVIFEQYDNGGAMEKPHYLASGTKCFAGPGVIAAVQDGLIIWGKITDEAAKVEILDNYRPQDDKPNNPPKDRR